MGPTPTPVSSLSSSSSRGMNTYKGKKLFTPGPLCTSPAVKQAMLVDLGSRGKQFMACTTYVRQSLLEIAQVNPEDYTAVLLQGSGTYCVEAVLQTTSPRQGAKVLVLVNGAYGQRMGKMCKHAGLEMTLLEFPEDQPIHVPTVERLLASGERWTTVSIVHCETSSGVVNPVEVVGHLVRLHQPQAALIVDAMSSFGAIPVDIDGAGIDYLVSSANKCLEGVPGFSFAICRKQHLLSCQGNCRVLSLDLVDQYITFESTGQFRFTPPTHTIVAFSTALRQYQASGGLQARAERYKENRAILVEGMKQLGFKQLVAEKDSGFIITSFLVPKHEKFDFKELYSKLSDKGQVIYPGKATKAECIRVGNIGHLFPEDMRHLLTCMEEVLRDMGLPIPLP
ncbi:2-aminoethylphosphonate--pyruvate transaminase-like [Panulirus ornatus]|uniref:2-aminoethylphosphonate--pyruvate transaminase-like n=1 Tax=Panulirus ornatus TaxID=150431 RepID=UPI003A85806E